MVGYEIVFECGPRSNCKMSILEAIHTNLQIEYWDFEFVQKELEARLSSSKFEYKIN